MQPCTDLEVMLIFPGVTKSKESENRVVSWSHPWSLRPARESKDWAECEDLGTAI